MDVIALRVPLIVNRILSFVGFEELKIARRVNSLWKIEAQSYFLQLAVGVIKVGEDDSPSLYVDEYHKYLHQNIKVRIINKIEGQKSIVSKFFSNHGEHIRSLQFMFECPYNMTLLSDCNFLNDTLASVPNLKELTLSIPKCHMHNEQETGEMAFRTYFPRKEVLSPALSNLQKFEIVIAVTSRSSFPIFMAMVQDIFELFRNALCLTVNVYGMDRRLNENCILILAQCPQIMPNLQEIHLTPISWDRELLPLLQIGQPLKRISLGSVNATYVKTTQLILEKHSQTLQSFKANIYVGSEFMSRRSEFANMPKLSQLEILDVTYSFSQEYENSLSVEKEHVPDSVLFDALCLSLLFRAEGLQIEPTICDKLPRLKILNLWISDSSGPTVRATYYDDLILRGVMEGTMFPKIRQLKMNYPENVAGYERWTIKLADTFPNVHNNQVNFGRTRR